MAQSQGVFSSDQNVEGSIPGFASMWYYDDVIKLCVAPDSSFGSWSVITVVLEKVE